MSGFDWTYDIMVDPIHIGSKFIINRKTIEASNIDDLIDISQWSNGEFIEFEITWIGINRDSNDNRYSRDIKMDEKIICIVISDLKRHSSSPLHLGYKQFISVNNAYDLINSGYWSNL